MKAPWPESPHYPGVPLVDPFSDEEPPEPRRRHPVPQLPLVDPFEEDPPWEIIEVSGALRPDESAKFRLV